MLHVVKATVILKTGYLARRIYICGYLCLSSTDCVHWWKAEKDTNTKTEIFDQTARISDSRLILVRVHGISGFTRLKRGPYTIFGGRVN